MKLTRLRVRNFRCYQDEFAVDFEGFTALVGMNDVGKSTLLDALQMFLNDETPDKDDASRGGNGADLTIVCEFEDLPNEVVLDEDVSTALAREYLVNASGRLEIHKTYSGHLATPKCTKVSARALHPSIAGADDLLQLKNADLKRRAKELQVDLTGTDQKVNAHLRAAIRAHLGDLKCEERLIPLSDENAKQVWNGLKSYMPSLALFKSDRASTDQDQEAQDPLKAAVREAIKAREPDLQAISIAVQTEVQRIADATLAKVQQMDPQLARELKPTIESKKWESLFSVSISGDEGIPINKRGSGIKRLILLGFFQARAQQESRANARAPVIYAVEEPETSQHPHNQRMLIRALTELSVEAQVVITTHTPMLARVLPFKSLRFIRKGPNGEREVVVGSASTNDEIAGSLGVLPDHSVRLFIGVEGPNDMVFLTRIAASLRKDSCPVPDLQQLELDGKIIFVFLGGSTLAQWTERLAPLKRPEFRLFDRDTRPPAPAKYQAQADEFNRRPGCLALITQKREIENYLHWAAINEAYSECGLSLAANFADDADVPSEVARLVHERETGAKPWASVEPDGRKRKESVVKRKLCSEAASRMTKVRLSEVDPAGEVMSWFAAIERMVSAE